MLFEFELRPVEAITPWGKTPGRLHWFGLTDGFYRMKLGDNYLFNYTDEITKFWKQEFPDLIASPQPTWVEYQVVRLWEDILDVMPCVLEPLPEEFGHILEKNDDDTQAWRDSFASCLNNEDEFWGATAWIHQRHLNSSYLSVGPSIRIWTMNDEVHIRWDNRACLIEGIPVWSADYGMYKMSVDLFLREVCSFHERLMADMEERVALILKNKGLRSVIIDLSYLESEQAERKQWLGRALRKAKSKHDIEAAFKVISANNFLNR